MNTLERFYLGRYLRAPKRYLFQFSFVFMILGIVLSVGILSAGLNLFEGYERSLKNVLLGSFPHAIVQSSYSESISQETAARLTRIIGQESNKPTRLSSDQPFIASVIPVLSSSIMASNGVKMRGSTLYAYDFSPQQPLPFQTYVHQGIATLRSGEVIIGKYLARELGKQLGDSITVVYPQLDRITPLGMLPSQRQFKVVGIYSSGFYEHDRSMLILTLPDASLLLNQPLAYSQLEVRFTKNFISHAPALSSDIQMLLGAEYTVYPWTSFSAGLLRLVAMEKWLIFIIFCFLVLIAGINVISAVATIILDRRSEIAVLKTLGTSDRSIRHLLSYRVGLAALFAIVLGQLFGALLSLFVEKQGFYRLKGDVYFIDSLTASFSPLNQLIVFTVAALLIFSCILYPLRQISRMQIIDLLRGT